MQKKYILLSMMVISCYSGCCVMNSIIGTSKYQFKVKLDTDTTFEQFCQANCKVTKVNEFLNSIKCQSNIYDEFKYKEVKLDWSDMLVIYPRIFLDLSTKSYEPGKYASYQIFIEHIHNPKADSLYKKLLNYKSREEYYQLRSEIDELVLNSTIEYIFINGDYREKRIYKDSVIQVKFD